MDRSVGCTYAHAIPDTWAVLWEACLAMRSHWLERIHAESEGALDGAQVDDFVAYFGTMVSVGDGKTISRIVLDVNWLTHTFFLGESPLYEQLR